MVAPVYNSNIVVKHSPLLFSKYKYMKSQSNEKKQWTLMIALLHKLIKLPLGNRMKVGSASQETSCLSCYGQHLHTTIRIFKYARLFLSQFCSHLTFVWRFVFCFSFPIYIYNLSPIFSSKKIIHAKNQQIDNPVLLSSCSY